MNRNTIQSGRSFKQFKNILNSFSDTNGGIKLTSISSFYGRIEQKNNLTFIEEAIKMLSKSNDEVFERFLDRKGWKLIDKWLIKVFEVQKPSDKEPAARILELILQLINRWLNKSDHKLGETTGKIIEQDWSTQEENQKLIQKYRSKWKTQFRRAAAKVDRVSKVPIQSKIHEPVSRRLRNKSQSSACRSKEADKRIPSLPKKPRTMIEKISVESPSSTSAPQSGTSHQSLGEDSENMRVNYSSTLHENPPKDLSGRSSASKNNTSDGHVHSNVPEYHPETVDLCDSRNERGAFVQGKEDCYNIYYRRNGRLNRKPKEGDQNMTINGPRLQQNVTVHMPGSITIYMQPGSSFQ